jgi:hypothetical protein
MGAVMTRRRASAHMQHVARDHRKATPNAGARLMQLLDGLFRRSTSPRCDRCGSRWHPDCTDRSLADVPGVRGSSTPPGDKDGDA